MKIVINKNHGGFSLNEEATFLYGKKKGLNIIKDEKKSTKFCFLAKASEPRACPMASTISGVSVLSTMPRMS